MMNPIRNIEKNPGPGGPGGGTGVSISVKVPDPLRHKAHNYPVKRKSALRLGIPKMQEGGDVEEPMPSDPSAPDMSDLREPDSDLSSADQDQKEIVIEAMAALRGQHPDPEKAIKRFVDTFGAQELEELKQMMQGDSPEPDEDDAGGPPDDDEDDTGMPPPAAPSAPPAGMQVGGLLHGPGAGQDDQIEAQTPSGRKVLLSDGEYVVDAPTVAVLGDGSTNAGAKRLDRFREIVRRQAYGSDKQAKKMSGGGRAALLEALNR